MPESATVEAPVEQPQETGALWDAPELRGLPSPVQAVKAPAPTEAVPAAPVSDKAPPEKPVEVSEPVVDTSQMSPKARENFARMEEARKKDRETYQSELEKLRTETKVEIEAREAKIKEYEERQSKLSTLTPEEITRRDQEIDKLKGELKFVALERDPDFISRYVTPKAQLMESLKELNSGTFPVEDLERAVKRGDQDKVDELRDSLQPRDQRRFDATLLQLEQVDIQKDLALKNRDTTYQQILQQRQETQKASMEERFNQNLRLAREVAMEPFEKVPGLKEDAALLQEVQSSLTALAGGEGAEKWDPRAIFQRVAASFVQTKILMTQHEQLQEKDAALAEKNKKIEELESFITSKHGALPNTQVVSGAPETVDNRGIWEQFGTPTQNGSSVKGKEFI